MSETNAPGRIVAESAKIPVGCVIGFGHSVHTRQ